MNSIKNLWRDPWARLFVVAWSLLLLVGFFLPGRYEQPIYNWHNYRGPEVNWWYFVLPPAVALAVRLVVRGFSSKTVADEPLPQPPLVPSAGTQISDVAAAVTPRRRRWLKWTLAAVFLVVWSAFVFGLGIEMHEKQMFAAQYQPGSVSYRLGSTAYTFGWDDGFKRGFELGVARGQAKAKAGGKGTHNEYEAVAEAIVDNEDPPEWGSALAAHQAGLLVVRGRRTGQDAAFRKPTSQDYLDSLVARLPAAAPAAPEPK